MSAKAYRCNRLTKADEQRFVDMWAAGDTREQIVAALGISDVESASRVQVRLGLPSRPRGWKPPAQPVPEIQSEPTVAAAVAPAMPPHPFWTPVRDLAVMGTAGRYPAVTALAAQMGRPVAAVLQRWHQLRAA